MAGEVLFTTGLHEGSVSYHTEQGDWERHKTGEEDALSMANCLTPSSVRGNSFDINGYYYEAA